MNLDDEATTTAPWFGDGNGSIKSHTGYSPAILMGIICSFGIVFNALVIFIILVLRDYKKTSHWYVLNLAFADGAFLLMLPLHLIEHLKGEWYFGLPLCVAYSATFYVNYYAGLFLLTVMSFDRYVAIVHPVSSAWRKCRSNKGCWVITIMVWMLSIATASLILAKVKVNVKCVVDFSSPSDDAECILAGVAEEHCELHLNITREAAKQLSNMQEFVDFDYYADADSFVEMAGSAIGSEEYPTRTPGPCLHPRFPLFIAWIYSNFSLAFVVPVITMAICYGCILKRVLRPRIRSSGSSKSKGNSRDKLSSVTSSRRTNHKITILVITLVAVFTVCWLPFHVAHMYRIHGIPWDGDSCSTLQDVVMLMAFSNSLLNPILYTFLGANFDRRLRDVQRRMARKNAATKEFFASFKQAHKIERHPYRGSLSAKTTKTTDSSDVQCPTSSDIRMQLMSPSYKEDIYKRQIEKNYSREDL